MLIPPCALKVPGNIFLLCFQQAPRVSLSVPMCVYAALGFERWRTPVGGKALRVEGFFSFRTQACFHIQLYPPEHTLKRDMGRLQSLDKIGAYS
jgi:hypothetical protein